MKFAQAAVALVSFSALVGCSKSSDSPGIEMTVVLDGPSWTSPPASPRAFKTDQAYTVILDHGYLATGTVEIVPCPSTSSLLRRFLSVGIAYAHSEGSPTLLGEPAVESLLFDSTDRLTIGTLAPPAATYCRAKWELEAADDDALGLPADVDMVGKTVVMSGSFSKDAASPQPFLLSSAMSFDAEIELPSVELSSGGLRSSTLHLTKAADHWFDGIDFAPEKESENTQVLLENIRRSLGGAVE